MKTIWKFPIMITDSQPIMMPKGAEILTVQLQDELPCLWAVINDDAPHEIRAIEIIGTGNPMHVDVGVSRKYIGTFQSPPFVWHVFELL